MISAKIQTENLFSKADVSDADQMLEYHSNNAWHNEPRHNIWFHTEYNKSYVTEDNL